MGKTKVEVVVEEIDRIAHGLYVEERIRNNETFALAIEIFTISQNYLKLNQEYYDRAELILREKKIQKIHDKNRQP